MLITDKARNCEYSILHLFPRACRAKSAAGCFFVNIDTFMRSRERQTWNLFATKCLENTLMYVRDECVIAFATTSAAWWFIHKLQLHKLDSILPYEARECTLIYVFISVARYCRRLCMHIYCQWRLAGRRLKKKLLAANGKQRELCKEMQSIYHAYRIFICMSIIHSA